MGRDAVELGVGVSMHLLVRLGPVEAPIQGHVLGELIIGGPTLAAQALRAGLVDEVHQVLLPVVIGAGPAVFPDDVRLDLELIDHRSLAGGAIALRHRVAGPKGHGEETD